MLKGRLAAVKICQGLRLDPNPKACSFAFTDFHRF